MNVDIDQQTATALGFPKPEYVAVERERRWLCRAIPRGRILHTEAITDLYVTGTRLRLREARRTDGTASMLRLSRKADVDPQTRLITSIYLAEQEFAILAASLQGVRIKKLRHRLRSTPGIALAVDEFQGGLSGLLTTEAEFDDADVMRNFAMPDFATREVTDDLRFTGSYLASNGVPDGFSS
jgi:CYTH domain-containing protein